MSISVESFSVDKVVGNSLSLGAIVGTLMGWLPYLAAIIAVIWYLIQIYETNTVQTWLRTRRLAKIVRLKEEQLRLENIEATARHLKHRSRPGRR